VDLYCLSMALAVSLIVWALFSTRFWSTSFSIGLSMWFLFMDFGVCFFCCSIYVIIRSIMTAEALYCFWVSSVFVVG